MNWLGQNKEDQIIDYYFGDFVGTLLSIGENDGTTYSNCLRLIQKGWAGLLIEPSNKVFDKLCDLHYGNEKIIPVKVAIGSENKSTATFYDSGDFLLKGTCSLLSTLKKEEIKRWGDVQFEEYQTTVLDFKTLMEGSVYKKFQFITIDCEGYDVEILKQMDLNELDCKCLCIEHNSVPEIILQILNYVIPFGFKEMSRNPENLILCR